jgi:hypothetical protein
MKGNWRFGARICETNALAIACISFLCGWIYLRTCVVCLIFYPITVVPRIHDIIFYLAVSRRHSNKSLSRLVLSSVFISALVMLIVCL